jgi:hypothetical protein
MVWGAFTPAHTGFRRLFGHRFMREDTNPNIAATTNVTRDSTPCRLNLSAGNPGSFQRLQSKIAKVNTIPHLGTTPAVSFMTLAVLHPLRL